MTPFTLDRDTLAAPITCRSGRSGVPGPSTLADALGDAPTLVVFLRHLG